MTLFILWFFAIYGGVHAYAFLRARSVCGFGAAPAAALALFMLLMTAAPFLIRALEVYEYERAARIFAYLSYFWLALLFFFFCSSLASDLVNLLIRTAGWITRRDLSPRLIAIKTSFVISLAFAVAATAFGYVEALAIRTERLTIETSKLPQGVGRLTIVQISDVHLGLIVRRERLAKMLAAVRAANPDIFVVTGDLVDAQINHLDGLADTLHEIKARYGNYAVMGNHEYYAGHAKAVTFIREAGFTLLRDEAATAGPITIVGLDDRTGERLHLRKRLPAKEILQKLPRDRFILMMKHQPRIDRASIGLFDLQISGHTHQGQLFPFTLLTHFYYPVNAGRRELGSGSTIYVNRGTGTWGPPVRFLAPPEVTVIELVRKATESGSLNYRAR